MPDNGYDGDGVDARLAACLAGCGFPDAVFACLVLPGDFLEGNPFCGIGGEVFDFYDARGLRHVVGGMEGLWEVKGAGVGDVVEGGWTEKGGEC